MSDDTWVITSYFNPCRYQTRRLNFELFAERLASTGARLAVIEMARDGDEFEVAGDHEVIQIRGGDVMWQKERLLNIAIAKLPNACSKVVWVDCDLLFENSDWLRATSEALDHHVVVQPFSECVHLRRGQTEPRGGEPIIESFAAAFARDPTLARDAVYQEHGHTGFAWAARRDLLATFGLYDACLTGSGDHLMAHVFAGAADSHCIPAMIGAGHEYAAHFARWATAVDRVVGGSLGHLEGRVLHLWHGDRVDRRYRERNQEFKHFGFDPARHIKQDTGGLWRWANAPAALREWAEQMFASRNEDGLAT